MAVSVYPIFSKVIPVQTDPSFKVDGTVPMAVADAWKFNPIRMQPYQPSLVATSTGFEDIDRCLDLCKKMEKYDPKYTFKRSDAIINFDSFIASLNKMPAGLSPAQKLEHAFRLFQDMGFVYEEEASLGYGLANKKYNCAVFCIIFKSIEKEMGLPANSLSIEYLTNCHHAVLKYNAAGKGGGQFYFDQGKIIPKPVFSEYSTNIRLKDMSDQYMSDSASYPMLLALDSYEISPFATCIYNAAGSGYPLALKTIMTLSANDQQTLIPLFINSTFKIAMNSLEIEAIVSQKLNDKMIVSRLTHLKERVNIFSRTYGISDRSASIYQYAESYIEYLIANFPDNLDGHYLSCYYRLCRSAKENPSVQIKNQQRIVSETVERMRKTKICNDDILHFEIIFYSMLIIDNCRSFDTNPDPLLRTRTLEFIQHTRGSLEKISSRVLRGNLANETNLTLANAYFELFSDYATDKPMDDNIFKLLIDGHTCLSSCAKTKQLDVIQQERYVSGLLRYYALSSSYHADPEEMLSAGKSYEKGLVDFSTANMLTCIGDLANIYSQMATMASNDGDPEKAAAYFNSSRFLLQTIAEKHPDPGCAQVAFIQAAYYMFESLQVAGTTPRVSNEQLAKTREYFEQTINTLIRFNKKRKSRNYRNAIACLNIILARIEIIFTGNGNKALHCLEEARKISARSSDGELFYLMSIAYEMSGDEEQAKEYAQRSSEKVQEYGLNTETAILRIDRKSRALFAQKNFTSVLATK